MIATDGSWIFVHIQKTGGNAVRSALGVELDDPHKHFLARELRQLYGEDTWGTAFKFAFVRNPWDRLVSWWSMIDGHRGQATVGPPPNKFATYVLQRAKTFDDFISFCTNEIVDQDGRKLIFRNQIEYLVDDRHAIIVDFIGRYESLQLGFDGVTAQLGLAQIKLPHVNASRHAFYTHYYTAATAKAVGRLFAADIDSFGYRFGG